MKNRRVLSLVLAFVMLMSCCFTGTASHVHAVGTEPTIVVSEVKAEAGKTAAVSISLENNPGIVNMILKVEYDTEMLTLVDVLDAGIFGETVHKPELQSPYTLCWANDTVKENFTITGTIVTLFFKVAVSASEGDVAEVKAYYDYDKNEIVDKDMQKVRFEVDNGSVTVGQPEANPISDFTYELSGNEMTITGYTGGARDVIIGSKYTVGGVEYTVTAIAAEAFVENTEITSVVIPETVKEIGEAAFYDCTSLTEVTVLSEDAEIGEVALGYYYISRREDGVVEGFTIKGYPGSTAQEYADAEAEITFVALDKPCEHTGGEATCKDKAICTKCEQPYGELNPNNHKNTETRDAATPSCNESGYSGDTWCKDCNTKTATGTSIPATGDHKDADGDWEVNQTHHFHTCGCGTEFDSATHTGGTATCKEKAVCSVCGTAYGNLNSANHTGGTYLVGQKEATCYEEGYTGDTYCSGCDVKIATGTAIEKDSHNPASVWSTDETHHWKECQTIGCGNLIDKAEHTGGEATCKTKAVCSVCNVPYGELNANNHKNTEIRDAATPSCNAPGYTGDTWCKDCETKIETGDPIPATGNHIDADNKWETNENQHFHTCTCGTEFDHADHTGGTATCRTKATCSVCGASYGELNDNNHTGGTEVRNASTASCNTPGYTGDTFCLGCGEIITTGDPIPATGNHIDADNKWESNENQHFHTCGCGTEFDKTDHTGGEATCKTKAVCSVCGASYGELNANNHAGGTYLVGQKEATCYEEGYTGDTYCSGCDQKIATGTVIEKDSHNPASVWSTDETHHWKECTVVACGNIIDRAEHTGGEATCSAKAVCSVCGVAYGSLNANNHKNTEIRDAATPSCNAPGYTGDTWCKDCETKIETGDPIPATGNHIDADNKWESNENQHFHTCGCGTEFDKADHTGGEATCKTKATCSVCGASYGELNANNHKNTEIRDAATPSCNAPGYTGDTWCKDCETKIETGDPIPATGNHIDADNKWESNENQHFHTCGCGTEFDKTDHTGGEATCKTKAVCSVCGASYGELNANNHAGGTYLVGQKEATCYEEGYTGDTYCSGCDQKIATGTVIEKDSHNPASVWSTDETHHWKECTVVACGNIIDRAEHTGGEATCSAKAVCSVCGVAYGSLNANNHKNTEIRDAATPSCNAPGYTGDTWCKDCETKIETGDPIPATGNHIDADNKWESNENQHFHTCACGTEYDKADHTGGEATCKTKAVCSVCGVAYGEVNADNHKNTEIRDAVEATCTVPGYTGDTWCKDCNTKIATGTEIPAAHKTVKVPAVEATHEKDGNIEYFTCSGCDKLFSDEAATTVITIADTVIAKGEHSYGETYEKDAENHWKLCSCGHIADKAAHTFGDWAETKAPTDKTPGEKRRECSVCKHYETAEIPVVSYEITHGADSEWTVGTNGELVFRANGDFAKFVGVEIDGQTVDPKNYTAVAGSTVITLKADYLDTLSVGEHTIKVVYQDGSASTNFEIQSKAASSDTPQTGDNSNLLLWIALMFVSGSALILTFGFSRKRTKQSR